MKKYSLEIIVFLSGAVVMVLELVGSRILAPYLGTSITVWTSLIGIILGCLSLGYYLGGLLADRNPSHKALALLLINSAIFIILIMLFKEPVLEFIRDNVRRVQNGTLASTIVLFAVPSILLGMVTPFSVKMKMSDLNKSASTVGGLYAISTLGSIIGTFLAGFILIPLFGTSKILALLSATLSITALLAYADFKQRLTYGCIAIFLFSSVFLIGPELQAKEIVDFDTRYNRVQISENIHGPTGRPIRYFKTEYYGTQSAMFLDQDDDLVFDYTKYYRLAGFLNPGIKNALMIGGGAYSFPKDFLKKMPSSNLDVVEIDPGLTQMAKKYFNLTDDPRLTIHHMDGRVFLNTTGKKYDAVYIDAFGSSLSVPFHLTTQETVQRIYDCLNENGIVMANIISSIAGKNGKFLRAEYLTYASIFPQVYIFPVKDSSDGNRRQNIILLAAKSVTSLDFEAADNEANEYLKNIWTKKISGDVPILTDEYAPAESYIEGILD